MNEENCRSRVMHLVKSSCFFFRLEPKLSAISFQIISSLVVVSFVCFPFRPQSVVGCCTIEAFVMEARQASCTMRMPIWSLSSALLFSLAASSLVCRLFFILSFNGWKPTYCSL